MEEFKKKKKNKQTNKHYIWKDIITFYAPKKKKTLMLFTT